VLRPARTAVVRLGRRRVVGPLPTVRWWVIRCRCCIPGFDFRWQVIVFRSWVSRRFVKAFPGIRSLLMAFLLSGELRSFGEFGTSSCVRVAGARCEGVRGCLISWLDFDVARGSLWVTSCSGHGCHVGPAPISHADGRTAEGGRPLAEGRRRERASIERRARHAERRTPPASTRSPTLPRGCRTPADLAGLTDTSGRAAEGDDRSDEPAAYLRERVGRLAGAVPAAGDPSERTPQRLPGDRHAPTRGHPPPNPSRRS
jgi:hypothetical protein